LGHIQRNKYFNWFQFASTLIDRSTESDACGYWGFGTKCSLS